MQVHSRQAPVVEIYSQSADDTLLTIVNGEVWTEGMPTPPGIYMAAKGEFNIPSSNWDTTLSISITKTEIRFRTNMAVH